MHRPRPALVCAQVQGVAGTVNGPLLQALAEATGFKDKECIEFFRKGARLTGKLAPSGLCEPKQFEEHASIAELWAKRAENAKKLLSSR